MSPVECGSCDPGEIREHLSRIDGKLDVLISRDAQVLAGARASATRSGLASGVLATIVAPLAVRALGEGWDSVLKMLVP